MYVFNPKLSFADVISFHNDIIHDVHMQTFGGMEHFKASSATFRLYKILNVLKMCVILKYTCSKNGMCN